MSALTINPSLWKLHRTLGAAKLRMSIRRFRTPRRLVLSAVALALTIIWLSQAVLGILYRAPANPESLKVWIPVGLLAYGLWHVLKSATREPIEPFEWTDTERELLIAAPLDRNELVNYRLMSIVTAAIAKSLCFGLVMIPDLAMWPLGFLGMFLALVFLDLMRMTTEVATWGVTRSLFLKIRGAVLAIAAAVVISAASSALIKGPIGKHSLAIGLIFQFFASVIELRHTLPGQLAVAPFTIFSKIILADTLSLALVARVLSAALMVCGLAWLLIRWDDWLSGLRHQREITNFPNQLAAQEQLIAEGKSNQRATNVPRAGAGITALMWRQFRGMMHYRSSILISMILPGFLSLLPLMTRSESNVVLLIQVVGSLVFYSFLLMPAALRFDFRRDVDRMAVLKAYPITPLRMTIGQLSAPIIVCTLFQFAVIMVCMTCRPFPLGWLIGCTALLLLVNLLIFGLENLIFLLYPYRPNQEGVGVFMRSILTFTAKGVLFFLGVAIMFSWVMLGSAISKSIGVDHIAGGRIAIITSGMMFLSVALGVGLVWMVSRVFCRFDPSQDTPPAA
ncbi:MAG: hypothetical protein AAF497_00295 [Planctomycetota bacterium]